jgi:hypothetical protein
MKGDVTFEIIWLDHRDGGTPPVMEVGRETVERYDLDQAISFCSLQLAHQRGMAKSARGFVVHSLRRQGNSQTEKKGVVKTTQVGPIKIHEVE